jgi:ferrous iron transport protein A
MVPNKKSIADLKLGEVGTIKGFTDEQMSLKLLEMGVLPGTDVMVYNRAPLGDPISICVCGYNLSLRMTEASTILLE